MSAPGHPTDPTDPTDSSGPTAASAGGDVPAQRRLALNEDWAATVVGLLLLALILSGLWPGWLVP